MQRCILVAALERLDEKKKLYKIVRKSRIGGLKKNKFKRKP
jgi:hypothetical protein